MLFADLIGFINPKLSYRKNPNASIRNSSDTFSDQSSHPYVAADHAMVFNNRTLMSIEMS